MSFVSACKSVFIYCRSLTIWDFHNIKYKTGSNCFCVIWNLRLRNNTWVQHKPPLLQVCLVISGLGPECVSKAHRAFSGLGLPHREIVSSTSEVQLHYINDFSLFFKWFVLRVLKHTYLVLEEIPALLFTTPGCLYRAITTMFLTVWGENAACFKCFELFFPPWGLHKSSSNTGTVDTVQDAECDPTNYSYSIRLI